MISTLIESKTHWKGALNYVQFILPPKYSVFCLDYTCSFLFHWALLVLTEVCFYRFLVSFFIDLIFRSIRTFYRIVLRRYNRCLFSFSFCFFCLLSSIFSYNTIMVWSCVFSKVCPFIHPRSFYFSFFMTYLTRFYFYIFFFFENEKYISHLNFHLYKNTVFN